MGSICTDLSVYCDSVNEFMAFFCAKQHARNDVAEFRCHSAAIPLPERVCCTKIPLPIFTPLHIKVLIYMGVLV
jgi:hypothetical protein